MNTTFDYSARYVPPAPVLPVLAEPPGNTRPAGDEHPGPGRPGVLIDALVDTGADRTVVPAWLPARLDLHTVDALTVATPTGAVRAPVHVIRLRVADVEATLHVLALGDDALLGRDVLAAWVLRLDGPAERLDLTVP